MKKIVTFIVVILISVSAHAIIPTILGGKPMTESTAHHISVGWPGLSYEWWNSGSPDWGLGLEFVYGDWSGEFSDVNYGLAFNIPMLWQFSQQGNLDIGFRLAPGVMYAATGGTINNIVTGLRGDIGLPATVTLNDKVNLLTGVTVPFSYLFVENTDNFGIVPVLARFGVEVEAEDRLTPFILVEAGPTFGINSAGTDTELGVRITAGCTIW
jgi:hypothetical protein